MKSEISLYQCNLKKKSGKARYFSRLKHASLKMLKRKSKAPDICRSVCYLQVTSAQNAITLLEIYVP
jgi:hypothetical protein